MELDGCLWVLGGIIDLMNQDYCPVVESYDPSTDRWTVQPPLPMSTRECYGIAATTHQGKIVVVGACNLVFIRGAWVRMPSVPDPYGQLHSTEENRGILEGSAAHANLVSLPLW